MGTWPRLPFRPSGVGVSERSVRRDEATGRRARTAQVATVDFSCRSGVLHLRGRPVFPLFQPTASIEVCGRRRSSSTRPPGTRTYDGRAVRSAEYVGQGDAVPETEVRKGSETFAGHQGPRRGRGGGLSERRGRGGVEQTVFERDFQRRRQQQNCHGQKDSRSAAPGV